MRFFPLFSQTAQEKASLRAIRARELRVYRRYPSFILGFAMLVGSWVATIYFFGWGVPSFLIVLGSIFGVALIHDTITLHLLRVIQRAEKKENVTPPSAIPKV